MTLADDLLAASAPAIPLKVLLYDLETSPMLAWQWSPRDEWTPSERMVRPPHLLTWSAKWWKDPKIHSGCITPDEIEQVDDSRIVRDLSDMIQVADFVVAHNGDRFDWPVFHGRLSTHGLPPITVRTIDTCKLAKRHFKFPYNNLDWLGENFELGRKLKTGWPLWEACMAGDPTALRKMVRYNRQDVVLLEQVFDRLLPYVKIPRLMEATDVGQGRCPHCGSANLAPRARPHLTNASTFPAFDCRDCLKPCRSRKGNNVKFGLIPL